MTENHKDCTSLQDVASHFDAKTLARLQTQMDLAHADSLAKAEATEKALAGIKKMLELNGVDAICTCESEVLRFLGNYGDWDVCDGSTCESDHSLGLAHLPPLLTEVEQETIAFSDCPAQPFTKTVKILVLQSADMSWDKIPLDVAIHFKKKLSVDDVVFSIASDLKVNALDPARAGTPWRVCQVIDAYGTRSEQILLPVHHHFSESGRLIYQHQKTFAELVSLNRSSLQLLKGGQHPAFLATIEVQIFRSIDGWIYDY